MTSKQELIRKITKEIDAYIVQLTELGYSDEEIDRELNNLIEQSEKGGDN